MRERLVSASQMIGGHYFMPTRARPVCARSYHSEMEDGDYPIRIERPGAAADEQAAMLRVKAGPETTVPPMSVYLPLI